MLKNYIKEKKLGEGAFGIVYKVKKKVDKDYKYFVLKQIPLLGQSEERKKYIKSEAEILSTIKSKYVVKYYESFEEENNLNIIMEYCEKGDLDVFIQKKRKEGKSLSEKEILELFIKITIGLGEIHKMNILHRDLKSSNVFLKNYNEIRVGDLGVAKALDNTLFAKTQIGTPYYISPEICEDRPYNDKSDVWTLGCILYELCTFRHPFEAENQPALIMKILNENPRPITNYSLNLKSLIGKLFNKNFRNRPSCIDILKDKYILGSAEELYLIKDIKKSFPEIFNPNIGPKKIKPNITKERQNNFKKDENDNLEEKNTSKSPIKIDKKKKSPKGKNRSKSPFTINNKKIKKNKTPIITHNNKINKKKKSPRGKNKSKSPFIKNNKKKEKKNSNNENKEKDSNKNINIDKKGDDNNIIPIIPNNCTLEPRFNSTVEPNLNKNIFNNKGLLNTLEQNLDNVKYIQEGKKENEDNKKNEKQLKLENALKALDIKGSLTILNSAEFNKLIDEYNGNGEKENVEEEKKDLKDDLKHLGSKIENIKEELKKSYGKEKYDQITKIFETEINKQTKSEEVNNEIETFIKQNPLKDNKLQKSYDIYSLYIFKSQYAKKEKKLNNL